MSSRILVRGCTARKEFSVPFRQCADMLQEIGAVFVSPPLDAADPVDFVLFFQSYPQEFRQDALMRLRRNNPFTPFFFVLGTCCEGMFRTAGKSSVWYGPFYHYANAWIGNETDEIRRFLKGGRSLYSLPPTSENDEIALYKNPVRQTIISIPNKTDNQHIPEKCLILTQFVHFGNDSAMNLFLEDEKKSLGLQPVFSEKQLDFPFSGKIFADADDAPIEEISKTIQKLRKKFPDNDLTVYVNSPRINEKEFFYQAGATQILPKMRG